MNPNVTTIDNFVSKLSAESTQSGINYNIGDFLFTFEPCVANRTLFCMNCVHKSSVIQLKVSTHIDVPAATLDDCAYVELTNNG